jgi:glycosyltransferase involved in cell wall biosynthesis
MSTSVASLHCLATFDNKVGGSVHAALTTCKYLARAGHRAEAIAPFSQGDDLAYLPQSYPEVTCHTVERSFPSRYSNSRELGEWLEKNLDRFDLVEIHGIWVLSTWHVARACQRRRKPYIVRPHGSLDPFDLKKHAWQKRLLGPLAVSRLLQRSALVMCTAELERQRLVTYGSNPRSKAMPLPVILPGEKGNGGVFRRKHKIPADAQVVLFLSRIDYKKGLDFLIPALAMLKRAFPKLWFVLAGAGDPAYVTCVRHWLEETSVRSFATEVGFVTGQDKLDAYAAADIFALPSLNENFGIVLIEAMNAGLPVLISDEVYIHKEVAEAGAGVICQPALASVAAALRPMLDGSVDLRAMGARGRAAVQERYLPEKATESLVAAYRALIGRNSQGAFST